MNIGIEELHQAAKHLIHIAGQLQPQVNTNLINTDAELQRKCYNQVKKSLPGIEKFLHPQNTVTND